MYGSRDEGVNHPREAAPTGDPRTEHLTAALQEAEEDLRGRHAEREAKADERTDRFPVLHPGNTRTIR